MKTTATIFPILALLLSPFLFGQARSEFEVASIRPATRLTPDVNVGLHVDGAQVRATYLSIKDLIAIAYPVKFDQIIGPDWIASERFDIVAKLPDGAVRTQVPGMLQRLLEDRFQMKVHRDKKEFPIYSLEIVKGGLNLKELPPDPEADPNNTGTLNVMPGGASITYGGGSAFLFADNKLESKKLTMAIFTNTLGRFMDRPVIDATELKGRYDFVLNLSPEDFNAMMILSAMSAGVVMPPDVLRRIDGASFGSLTSALQKIGLKLQPVKAPLDVLVIDSIQKKPTDN